MVDFDLELTDSDVASFLLQIHVEKNKPSPIFLQQIIAGVVEHVPHMKHASDVRRGNDDRIRLPLIR